MSLLVAYCVVAGPALAASQRDKDDCTSNDPDRVIAGCTRIVQDRLETTKSLATAYNNRGSGYFAKGDYNRAIADLSEAIRLDPKDVTAYNRRGLAYDNKGNADRAIADYSEAIRLDAKIAVAYFNRGRAYDSKDDIDRANADNSEVNQHDRKHASAFAYRGRDFET